MSPESLREFEPEELLRFLAAIDRHLSVEARMILLGGSAIALYGVQAGTTDIDTWETDLSKLTSAIDLARAETGLDIPVSDTPGAEVPYEYEGRLQLEEGTWTRLQVFKLERHDLALSKTIRGRENDLAAIEKLHRLSPLDMDTLVDRYLCEMTHILGDRSRIDLNIELMIQRLYGEIAGERVGEKIRHSRR